MTVQSVSRMILRFVSSVHAPPPRMMAVHELARAASLASEAEDCDEALRAQYLDEATGRTRAALAAYRGGSGSLSTVLEARRELAWACALHEMGMMVSHHDHHRHSAYLLAHVDAPGFSQSQQRRVAELVLGQRGGLRKVETGLTQEAFAWQVLCLRLAIIKCHARADVRSEALALQRNGNQAQLSFASDWLVAHPRTLYLLQEEVQAWARGGVLRLALRD